MGREKFSLWHLFQVAMYLRAFSEKNSELHKK